MTNPLPELLAHGTQLTGWLIDDAAPLWFENGVDPESGGFVERLDQTGAPIREPRRARVQPRQLYAFSMAAMLGWDGPVDALLRRGLKAYLAHYQRPDGLFRTLADADGSPLDERMVVYDQAFAILACATMQAVVGPDDAMTSLAHGILDRLSATMRHPVAGFEESSPRSLPLASNPHMHLFEAFIAWIERREHPRWRQEADAIAALAQARFIDPHSGMLREFFDGDWSPAAGTPGRIVEPGHQFEWAWLLLRWAELTGQPAPPAALRLIEIGETLGVDPARGVAMNALLDDGARHDAGARLWPQTERLKANCAAAMMTGEARYWAKAAAAAESLNRYLDTPTRGLWRDKMTPDGAFVEEPAPASSFYHIVAAIAELNRAAARHGRVDAGGPAV